MRFLHYRDSRSERKIIDLIKAKCIEAGSADVNIMLAIAGVESHFKPYAVSYRGATGIFQLTEKQPSIRLNTDRLDWHQNISGGIRYFQELTKRFTKRGNVLEKRLIAWQSGQATCPTPLRLIIINCHTRRSRGNL